MESGECADNMYGECAYTRDTSHFNFTPHTRTQDERALALGMMYALDHGYSFLLLRLLLLLGLSSWTPGAHGLDNGLARTPPMGWMTWERFRCTVDCADDPDNCLTGKLIRDHANILAQPEWRDAGYTRVNIDDCWANMVRGTDADGSGSGGVLVANTSRFPAGMKALADYVHSKGLKLGIYNDVGTKTCGGYPGECEDKNCSLPGYMALDAKTYAAWGIDSLKMDGCNSVHTAEVLDQAYIFIGQQLNQTGRPILYSCSWPDYIRAAQLPVNYSLVAEHCNIWRMYDDVQDSYDSVQGIVDWVGVNAPKGSPMQTAAGPGSWNDPDMLIIGNYGLSFDQSQAQMALWSIMAAPLLMGNDLRSLDPAMKDILTNTEVIAVDQDPLGVQGWRVKQDTGQCTKHDVWMRPLVGGDVAVVVWFRGTCGTHEQITVAWSDIELLPNQGMLVRDLFARQDLGTFTGSWTGFVKPSGGVRMLRLSKPKARTAEAVQSLILNAAVRQLPIFDSLAHGLSPWNTSYSCFRVPSVVQNPKTKMLVAFVESRIGSCHDQAPKDITMRRSTDFGSTWTALTLVVGPQQHHISAGDQVDFSARNPYAWYDDDGTLFLQWVNSTVPTTCVNYQMQSSDDGVTWTVPTRVDFGKQWEGTLLGPGNGIVLGRHSASVEPGRFVVCGASGYVGGMPMNALVWTSDDHGATWQQARSPPFKSYEECQVVELNNGSVAINMRHPGGHRAVSVSLDGGTTWETPWLDTMLPDPTCSAGLINFNGSLYFSNDPTERTRQNMTLKRSRDGGSTWETVVQLTDGPSAYSVVTPVRDEQVAVVYETGVKAPYEKIMFAAIDV